MDGGGVGDGAVGIFLEGMNELLAIGPPRAWSAIGAG